MSKNKHLNRDDLREIEEIKSFIKQQELPQKHKRKLLNELKVSSQNYTRNKPKNKKQASVETGLILLSHYRIGLIQTHFAGSEIAWIATKEDPS